jgi:hypothetical protein
LRVSLPRRLAARLRPKPRFVLRRLLPAMLGLVLGWLVAGYWQPFAMTPGNSETTSSTQATQPDKR